MILKCIDEEDVMRKRLQKMMSCTGCYHINMNEGSEPCFSCIDVESRPNYKPEKKIMNKPTNITCPTESQIIDGYKVSPELMEKLFPDVIKEHLESEAEKDKYFDLGRGETRVFAKCGVKITVAGCYDFANKSFYLDENRCEWELKRIRACLYLIPTKKQ